MSPGGLTEAASTASSPFVRRLPEAAGHGAGRATADGGPRGAAGLRIADPGFERAAREGAFRVGDACLIWRVVDGGRRLEPCAANHRERRLTHALGAFLDQELFAPDDHWPGQVTWHGAPVRVRNVRLLDLGVGTAAGMRRAHALIVPVLDGGFPVAIIAALREGGEACYSLRDEVILRRVAAKTARIAARAARRDRACEREELRVEAGELDDARGEAGGPGREGGGDAAGGAPAGDDDREERDGSGGDGDGDDHGDEDGGASGNGAPPLHGPGWAPPPSWLMDHLDVGVWITDGTGITTYVNNAMTELLGVPSPKVLGRPMSDYVDDIPHTMIGEFALEAERCDRHLTLPDGRVVWFEMTSTPLVDDEGRRRGTVNTVVDVTGRKQVELSARRRVPRAHRRR